jgi:uncharacterized protein YjiS (DUF1127 family)
MPSNIASPSLIVPVHPLPPLSGLLLALTLLVLRWETLRRTRKDLSRLAPHMLKDIGMDRLQAHHEARKPFWRD